MHKSYLNSSIFWGGVIIGTLAMIVVNAHPLELSTYFYYGWAGIREIPLDEFDVWFGLALALLTGWNLGGILYLGRCHALARGEESGILGIFGATIGYFALSCAACQSTLLTIFGTAIAANVFEPYLPALKFVSFALLVGATIILTHRLSNPTLCSVRAKKKSRK